MAGLSAFEFNLNVQKDGRADKLGLINGQTGLHKFMDLDCPEMRSQSMEEELEGENPVASLGCLSVWSVAGKFKL